jgi:hypothetical protein
VKCCCSTFDRRHSCPDIDIQQRRCTKFFLSNVLLNRLF